MSRGELIIPTATGEVVISVADLTIFEAHRGDLTRYEYDDIDENGKPCTRLAAFPKIDGHLKLISEHDAKRLEAELMAALVSASFDQAAAMIRTMMGRYEKKDLYDPDIFVFEGTRLLAENPADLDLETIDELRNKRWLPNPGDISGILIPKVRERQTALDQVRRHIAEHERRRKESKEQIPRESAEERTSHIEMLHGKYPEVFGISLGEAAAKIVKKKK